MSNDESDPPYAGLAATIVAARQLQDLTQGALALQLTLAQQSVSRWEAGTHRPSVEQIPALAGALRLKADDLRLLAGYGSAAAARLPHFPLDQLGPETFEQLVADLTQAQHPEARVRIEGGRGHDQSGIDVRVQFADRLWVIQCKQMARFGPGDVRDVIAKVTIAAERKILALSRIASPKAAAIIDETPGWSLWDLNVLSRAIRALPGEDQDRLVDTYFPGQRMALLGRRESGPWLTPKQFFAPFTKPGAYFNHEWAMQGRARELADLAAALGSKDPATLLVAAGGMGKSRLVLAAIDAFQQASPATTTLFLSAVRNPTRESLEAIGPGDKLIVVDDAHDRDGLSTVIEFAADPANRTRLLFATRPYALQRLRNELVQFGIDNAREITLERLPRKDLEAIVAEVLERNGAARDWAELVAGIAGENPLIATMAARVIASEGQSLDMARHHDRLRNMVLGKFASVITGSIGEPGDAPALRAMLELVAVVQPVHLNDRRLGELFEATTDFSATQASRALRVLSKGGVIYKRGAAYRLMPDVLGDYLIDESCVAEDGKLTLFAEKVIATVDREQLEQVMVNLGRMDWRRNQGDPSNSNLLDRAWARLDEVDSPYDPRFAAVRAVAIYQPRQALAYVQRHLHDHNVARELTPILRNIAFTPDYRLTVCQLLWEMGRDDERGLGQHPNHPIRVLAELCRFGEYKPFEISEAVANFAFTLIAEHKDWGYHYSPLDILEPLLSGVVEANRDHGRSMSFGRYFLGYDYAWPLRSRVLDVVIDLLGYPDPAVAVRAASLVDDILRLPMGLGSQVPPDSLRARYQREFARTMTRLRERVVAGDLASATMITVARGVEWHARYNRGRLLSGARALLDALPSTLDFRLRAALVEGAQRAFRGQTEYDEWSDDNPWLDALVIELKTARGTPDATLTTVETAMAELNAASVKTGSAYMLVSKLVEADLDMASAVIERGRDPQSPWRGFAYLGVREILERDLPRGRAIIDAALANSDADSDFARRAAAALGGVRRPLEPADLALLRRAISAPREEVVIAGLNALQWDRSISDEMAFELLMLTPIELSENLLATVARLLEDRNRKLYHLLTEHDVTILLDRLRHVRTIEGSHWILELFQYLAAHFPLRFADYLFTRANEALAEGDEGIELLGYRFHEGKLGFDKSPDATHALAFAWDWLMSHKEAEGWTIYRVVGVFEAMFDVNARVVVDFLDLKIDTASPIELRLIGRLLRHSHHAFAFRERSFVERLLERVASADPGGLDDVRHSIGAAAFSGLKSGVRGEPMPRDIEAKAKAEAVLADLSRFSPAYPIYEEILRDAEQDIARAVREGQILDELE